MISLVAGDKDAARSFFENAIRDDSEQTWNGEQVLYATVLSALYRDAGNRRTCRAETGQVQNARYAGPGSTVWMMLISITRNPVFMR